MKTENLSTLKIHKLTQEQYDRELAAGNIDENALYLTPDNKNEPDIIVDDILSNTSVNPVQNKIITTEINEIKEDVEDLQTQIDQLDAGGSSIIIESELRDSENPVQSKVIKAELDKKVNSSSLKTVATSGSYNDLTDKPTIPINTSQLINDSNYVDETELNNAINSKANNADLTAHTSNKNNPHSVTLSQLGVTATAAELNTLDGITATTTELNYVDGVTSNIQTQLNGKASAGFHKEWSCATTVGSYSKLCRISGYSNFIMRIGLSQSNQVSYFTLLIGTGYASASVTCLGGSNFSANSNQIVRLTQQSAQVFDVEFYNTYGYNSATSVNVTCNILSPHSDINVTTYTAYTATSGTSVASCTCRPSGIVAPTFYGDLSGNADTATKLTSSNGSATQPIYFSDGKPVNCSYTLGASVPSGAKFTDTVYTHPTTSGNKHIPSGGSSGQILRWSANGTAAWGADNNTTYSVATSSTDGLTPKADASAGTISSQANQWVLTRNGTTVDWYNLPTNAFNNTTYSLSSFGVNASATELNYTKGVTSNIQTQITNNATNISNLTHEFDGDLNNLTTTGLHYVANANAPNYPEGSNGHVLVISSEDEGKTRLRQIFFRMGSTNAADTHWYSRSRIDGNWSAWWQIGGANNTYKGTASAVNTVIDVGNINGPTGGWLFVVQLGTSKALSTVTITRAFLTTTSTSWTFQVADKDNYLSFNFYNTADGIAHAKIKASNDTTNNAIKYVYTIG